MKVAEYLLQIVKIFAFFVIAVAAAEAAVGLAIVIGLFRLKKSVSAADANLMKH